MEEVLVNAGIPEGMLNVIRSLYSLARAVCFAWDSNGRADMKHLLWFFSGIAQGCPLSGSMFAILMDPILCMLCDKFDCFEKGPTRVCADDICSVFASMSLLPDVAKCFQLIQDATSLTLGLSKCVVVPLAPPSCDLFDEVKKYIRRSSVLTRTFSSSPRYTCTCTIWLSVNTQHSKLAQREHPTQCL